MCMHHTHTHTHTHQRVRAGDWFPSFSISLYFGVITTTGGGGGGGVCVCVCAGGGGGGGTGRRCAPWNTGGERAAPRLFCSSRSAGSTCVPRARVCVCARMCISVGGRVCGTHIHTHMVTYTWGNWRRRGGHGTHRWGRARDTRELTKQKRWRSPTTTLVCGR